MRYTYKIFNNKKITNYATIEDTITGVKIGIEYAQLSTFSDVEAKKIIEEITNKLNHEIPRHSRF